MNPLAFAKIKPLFEKFNENHPKVPLFFKAASKSISEGSIIEIKVTPPGGEKELITNMRVNSDDMELIDEMRKIITKEK